MRLQATILALLLAAAPLLLDGPDAGASGDHGHDEQSGEEQPSGPHGGRLLQQDKLGLELTLYEQGLAPELRVYPYLDGQPLPPGQLELEVSLERLGGTAVTHTFQAERDYLLSPEPVGEPHSFDVKVKATYGGRQYQWVYASYEGRTEISEEMLQRAGVKTGIAGPRSLLRSELLYGVIEAPSDGVFHLMAPYPGLVEEVSVNVGERVSRGQSLARLRNTQTLQSYIINSPSDGEVTARHANPGEVTAERVLLEVSDLSEVWVEMAAFPHSIEQLKPGQRVEVRDLHRHASAWGEVNYISPVMTGGHIARARSVIANPDGHWRPGMHIRAAVETGRREVPLAVRRSGLQNLFGRSVVFVRHGDSFEARPVETGESDGEYLEVLAGIKAGDEYVTENSFLLKADILKDGASHDH